MCEYTIIIWEKRNKKSTRLTSFRHVWTAPRISAPFPHAGAILTTDLTRFDATNKSHLRCEVTRGGRGKERESELVTDLLLADKSRLWQSAVFCVADDAVCDTAFTCVHLITIITRDCVECDCNTFGYYHANRLPKDLINDEPDGNEKEDTGIRCVKKRIRLLLREHLSF